MNEEQLYQSVGWNGLFSMFVTLGLVVVAWVALREVRWEKLVKHPLGPGAQILKLLLAVAIGHQLAAFLLDYWNWTSSLKWLFGSN
ncbi:DUF1146 family protein [Cohnella fermenti]|uniref:DUF1146 domain-containing protein n=1 Tax=Cohnella fermenti TaxID=2565925 RepID=A0A4S4BFL9_9BACL|nr:DUF1146 domain-containing protein [Cohnella fermenti]THF73139.1 DUF1146 domain-containing protein [Cohnella fermenti]